LYTNQPEKWSSDEEESNDAFKPCRQKETRVQKTDVHKSGQENPGAPSAKGKKEVVYLMIRKISLRIIDLYQQYVRIYFPACCRFTPTCSEYARLALVRYGLVVGSLKALCRILKCQPFNPVSGYDPLK